MTNNKILSLEDLAAKARELRGKGKHLVLCHGTFDLMHTGHIRHLQRARQEGDILLVTITGDAYVNKGPGRPVFTEELRAETLAALSCVDYVAINHAETAVDAINKLKPHIYAKGSDYQTHSEDLTGNIAREKDVVEANGGDIFYTNEITFSSSSLLNEHFGIFPQETRSYLRAFRDKFSDKDVVKMLKSLSKLKVLVIGDAIIDQYHYTAPLGQTGKGNILAVKYESEEQFAGGALAVANHLSGFVDNVTLVTGLGMTDSHEEFIRSKLSENISPIFFYLENAPTVTKRRFVDYDLAKFFEVYFFKENPVLGELDAEICSWLEREVGDYDVVVVPDFGNGFISPNMIKELCGNAHFLAVNTQVNSGNRGYHVINHYPRADFVSLNEPELRLSAHNRHDPLETVAESVCKKVQANSLAVTRGTKGVILLDKEKEEIHSVPALSTKVLDRIGAGDAFLSFSGLCLGGGLPAEVAAFVGSAAAALDVQIVCNREPINPMSLYKYITTLLK